MNHGEEMVVTCEHVAFYNKEPSTISDNTYLCVDCDTKIIESELSDMTAQQCLDSFPRNPFVKICKHCLMEKLGI